MSFYLGGSSILAGSLLRKSLYVGIQCKQTDRQTTFKVYRVSSPRMFSVELWCTGSCFGHAGMVHRGGQLTATGSHAA